MGVCKYEWGCERARKGMWQTLGIEKSKKEKKPAKIEKVPTLSSFTCDFGNEKNLKSVERRGKADSGGGVKERESERRGWWLTESVWLVMSERRKKKKKKKDLSCFANRLHH